MKPLRRIANHDPAVWRTEDAPVAYETALAFMEEKARAIREDNAGDFVWLLEHPPLYTAGTSAKPEDLLDPRFPVHASGRGGQHTYHGPGQRVAYVMLDLQKRGSDLRAYVHDLEEWIIAALRPFGIAGERRPGRVGIWVEKDRRDVKIAAVGVRVRKWVAYHGISINVSPDLSHYAGIIPCGIKEYGVTSLVDLGIGAEMHDIDDALKTAFPSVFLKNSPPNASE